MTGICARESCHFNKTGQEKPLGPHGMCYDCERKHCKDKKNTLEKLNKKSIKQARLDRVYAGEAARHKAANPECQAKLIGCTGKATETHHTYSGAHKSGHYTDSSTFLSLCSSCHFQVHNVLSAAEAKKLNLKRS